MRVGHVVQNETFEILPLTRLRNSPPGSASPHPIREREPSFRRLIRWVLTSGSTGFCGNEVGVSTAV